MNKKLRQRVIASVLALVMVLGLLPVQFLGGSVEVLAATAYSLNADDVGLIDALTEAQTAGTDGYFTLLSKVKATTSNKTIDDMSFTVRIQTAGAMSTTQKAIAFTTADAATVKVYAQQSGGSDGDIRHVGIMDSTGANIATSPDLVKGTTADPFTLSVPSAGTYYIGGIENGIDIYYIEVTEGASAGSPEEPTTEEPTTEAPTEEPTTVAPTEEPTTETPTEQPTDAPTEAPVASEWVDGFAADAVAADTKYVYDFGANCSDIANSYTKGIFSFNAGNYHGASYNGTTYGVEFKSGNQLTFAVAGDCKIIVGGDNNNKCLDLAATSTTGTVTPATQSSITAGHATLDNVKEAGDNTLVYEYTGTAGAVTLTLDPSYTKAEGETSTKAYICYVATVPVKAPVDGFTVDTVEADTKYTFDFGANCSDIANSYTKGLFSFNAGNYHGASYNGTTYGVEFKSGNKLTFAVAGDCTIVIAGDNNNKCTNLAATSETGTVTPATQSTITAGHGTLENCLAKGDNTLIYSYEGEAGTVTFELDPGYTGSGNTKAYICYAAIMPGTTTFEEEVVVTVSGTVTGTSEEVVDATVAGGKLVFANPNGVKTEATINADGTYSVELVAGVAYTVTIDGVDYKLEDTLDLTEITENVTDNNYTAAYVEPPKTTDMSPTENPRPTVVKSYKVGYEGESGSYEKTATNGFVINGGGEYFGKDTMIDSLYTAGFSVPDGSVVTLTAKLTPSVAEGVTTGMLGAFGKEDVTEPDSYAYGMYWDVKTGFMRVGRHGGAGNTTVTLSDSVYIKMECIESQGGLYYTIASDASFSEESIIKPRSGMGCDSCSPNYVGFFATEGTTLTVEDIEIVATYTAEGETTETKKIVYSSAYGELIPEYKNTGDFGNSYGNTFSKSVDGNELNLVSVRGSENGNIRSQIHYDYLLFPETDENWTIKTDVTVNSMGTNTDKQGFVIGQYATPAEGGIAGSSFHIQKNGAMQHSYSNAMNAGNSGNPKNGSDYPIDINGSDENGSQTYTMQYKKNAADETYPIGYALMDAWDASGTRVVDGTEYAFDFSNGLAIYGDGQPVHYGIGLSVADVTISNTTIINEAGYVIYDQNDYYIVKGVAPIVEEVTATTREDRTAIDLAWTLSPEVEAKGNVQYIVQVSVDGGEYTKAGQVKVCEFSYPVRATGNYKFKVWAVSGESSTSDSAKESNAVDVLMPLTKPVLTATGDADSVALSWTISAGAVAYDVYRAVTSDGKFEVIATVDAPTDAEATVVTYDDTTAVAEEPVYYYVVSKSDSNSSNPSETMQAMVSAGHAYDYLVGTDADDLTITSKTNDTFFSEDKTFEIKGSYAVDGSAVLVINGVEGDAVACTAGTEVTFTGTLEDGRNDVEIIFTNADGKKSREVFNFVVNPHYDILVDAAFTGTEGEGEVPTYKTIGAALAKIPADNASQKVIFVKNGNYEERVVVTAPNVSILGEDKELTKQFASVAVYDKTATGMWDRNAFYVDSTADNFTLENIWVENNFPYTNGSDQQADALAIVADNVLVINVNLIGYQDTLLVDSRVKDSTGGYEVTNQYFKKCYITGNVDFIYGSGSAVFEDCDVVGRYTEYKADGCFTAARTYDYVEYGLIFNNCRFWSEAEIAAGAYRLARPWGADANTVFLNSYMDDSVSAVGYGDMSGNSYKNARFAEYNSSGAGYVLNNDRPLLSATQAEKYATATVLGADFAYETIMANMYSVPAVTYTVTVTADENGTASADVTEAAEGDTVTLTATPNEGYEFDGWVVVSGDVTITDNTFVMPACNVEVKATFVDPNPPVVDPVAAFVERMYTVVLDRDAEEAGLNNWVTVLKAGTHDGAGIAAEFVLGEEFKLKNLDNSAFLDVLYKTFFNREADAEGKAFWMSVLEAGYTREFVLSNFVNLDEFTMVCASYGIQRGVLFENGVACNPGVVQFVNRLYTLVMGRDADKDGLYLWTISLTVGAETAESAAKNFFNGAEYALKATDNATYVKDLYAVFMGREADEAGLDYWANVVLGAGFTRDWVLEEFAKSEEFKGIAASYGLQ